MSLRSAVLLFTETFGEKYQKCPTYVFNCIYSRGYNYIAEAYSSTQYIICGCQIVYIDSKPPERGSIIPEQIFLHLTSVLEIPETVLNAL